MAGGIVAGPIASDVEQAEYHTNHQEGAIELREYAPAIVAETEVKGERKEAISEGFRRIADYIFGNNRSSQSIAMTAPVIQQQSETIAMTAPVLQTSGAQGWKVQFVMPANYTLTSLPKPNNDAVHLRRIDARQFAAITFSGMADDDALKEQTSILQDYLVKHKLRSNGAPVYAFYNPPWTLPFMRRNEVLIPITNHR